MPSASQVIDTLDDDCAIDLDVNQGPHLLQEMDQIHDFRFDGGIVDYGRALGFDRRQQ